jgi:hypothetical protein
MQRHFLAREDGFTLIEMVIVMGIFMTVIIITSNAFNLALTQTKRVSKSDETSIEGVIGLEVLRHDLQQAGFGLFTAMGDNTPVYAEAASGQAANYNDSPSRIPRAVVGGDNLNVGDAVVLTGTDYLAIKGTTVARDLAAQRWTYVDGPGAARVWGVNDLDPATDFVIAAQQSYKNGQLQRTLISDPTDTSSFSVKFHSNADSTNAIPAPFVPTSNALRYYYYGINSSAGAVTPRTPFNRTDYYVKRTSETPASCAPGAGVLYKATLNQADGTMNEIPILDCVADMQVALGWNTTSPEGPVLDTYSNVDASTVSSATQGWTPAPNNDPSDIRKHLKLIKVYLLAQDGGKDLKFRNTETAMIVGTVNEAVPHTVNLTDAKYQNYRWKLYRVVVKPTNLM